MEKDSLFYHQPADNLPYYVYQRSESTMCTTHVNTGGSSLPLLGVNILCVYSVLHPQ